MLKRSKPRGRLHVPTCYLQDYIASSDACFLRWEAFYHCFYRWELARRRIHFHSKRQLVNCYRILLALTLIIILSAKVIIDLCCNTSTQPFARRLIDKGIVFVYRYIGVESKYERHRCLLPCRSPRVGIYRNVVYGLHHESPFHACLLGSRTRQNFDNSRNLMHLYIHTKRSLHHHDPVIVLIVRHRPKASLRLMRAHESEVEWHGRLLK
mmetsp:Transcript_77416/g.122256  ORF Transcript_77416/g.122256 Transcript_77416/m.122256 type:complete len:210 (+) Transcript_77416:711-1340(+)